MKCQILANLTNKSQREGGIIKDRSPPPSPTLSNEPCSPLKNYLQTFDPYSCLFPTPSSTAVHAPDRLLSLSPVPSNIQRPLTPLASTHSSATVTHQRPRTPLTPVHSTTMTAGHALSPLHHPRNSTVLSRRPSHPPSMAFQSFGKYPELPFQPSRSPESSTKVWRPW